MTPTVAIVATLDTKGHETAYLAEQIREQGCQTLIIDIGVLGSAAIPADVDRVAVARAGGREHADLLAEGSRQQAGPVMVDGATKLLLERLDQGGVQAVISLGGTQGTSSGTAIMRNLTYGFPKIMVSTVASGDTSAFVDIKDITMMFSVGDILGLNPVTRRILANAAGAACGMAKVTATPPTHATERPLIGMTNLGVLTEGAMHAMHLLQEAGYEVIIFHAVGSGGRAMEQMMKEGLIGAVFDYALGEIADELFDGLRASGPERLTVAGTLGLPQVICPGGAEHVGLFVKPNTVPDPYRDHLHVFHSPVILAPRLQAHELERVAREIGKRLSSTKGRACFMIPQRGSSRYAIAGEPLHDPEGDQAFWRALRKHMPPTIDVVERDQHAEEPEFVEEAVRRLIGLIESGE